jgi:hypothetical protein
MEGNGTDPLWVPIHIFLWGTEKNHETRQSELQIGLGFEYGASWIEIDISNSITVFYIDLLVVLKTSTEDPWQGQRGLQWHRNTELNYLKCWRCKEPICVLINYKTIKVYGGKGVFLHEFLSLGTDCCQWLNIHFDRFIWGGEALFILCTGDRSDVGTQTSFAYFGRREHFNHRQKSNSVWSDAPVCGHLSEPCYEQGAVTAVQAVILLQPKFRKIWPVIYSR